MLKRLLDKLKSGASQPARMPEVDERSDLEDVFSQARKAAAGEGETPPDASGRHVIIVTPGRLLMAHPCPSPGSMPREQVAQIKQMMPPTVKRNVAVISYTEPEAVLADITRAIPFIGMLMGLAYIGHAVWIFEGHASALAAGCRDADVLIVDSAMAPFLAADLKAVVSAVMRRPEIYLHDRATFSLRKFA